MTTTDRKSWKGLRTGQYVDLASLPAQPDRVIATTPAGELHVVTTDGVVQVLPDVPPLVLVDATSQGVLAGVTADGEVYRSQGPAGPWQAVGQVTGPPAAFDATDDAGWHVATEHAIYESEDGGATWREVVEALE